MRKGWGRGLMGHECGKDAPGVRRYKGGPVGKGEEKQANQFEKDDTMESNSSYVNKKMKINSKEAS